MKASHKSFDIVALGEPMVEFNQTGDGEGRLYLQGFGGDTSNFAISAARQGALVAYIGAVGEDTNGALFRQLWEREGVDHHAVKSFPEAYTGVYFVSHDERGHHFQFFRSSSAASKYAATDLPLDLIRASRVLHLSGISAAISTTACDACYAAVRAARDADTLVSFDTNLRLRLWPVDRARAVMSDLIRLSDLCLPSYEDIAAITGLRNPDVLVDHCLKLGAKIVALKLGADGAIVADAQQRYRIPPYPCNPVDATGAGDTFGGAFVARYLAGDDLQEAGRYAAVAAALSTQGFGAVEPIPNATQVLQAMALI
ncbi:sugar kinase (plasmid) [Acidovorax sp. DW039]|uniref:sugar kinase n=1 Tax=Acidovorax sp. DW039 TaxID=3095606 RepID=UPI0030858455|nr:sugar kinase [Acidovorax sp. DW039]